MKKYLIIAACFALLLGGCNLPTVNLQTQVDLNTLEGVISGYGIIIEQERLLKQLPLCKTKTVPGLTNICVKRSVVVNLQTSTRIAKTAIDNAVAFVAANPTIPPTQYISAAQTALLSVQAVYNANKPN